LSEELTLQLAKNKRVIHDPVLLGEIPRRGKLATCAEGEQVSGLSSAVWLELPVDWKKAQNGPSQDGEALLNEYLSVVSYFYETNICVDSTVSTLAPPAFCRPTSPATMVLRARSPTEIEACHRRLLDRLCSLDDWRVDPSNAVPVDSVEAGWREVFERSDYFGQKLDVVAVNTSRNYVLLRGDAEVADCLHATFSFDEVVGPWTRPPKTDGAP
jgi:hypothetical protein